MKILSIKLRVTLWFTLLMTLIVAVILTFLISIGEQMVSTASEDKLMTKVQNAYGQIEYDDGIMEADDEFSFLSEGVYLSVYNTNGQYLIGQIPQGFEQNSAFAADTITQVDNEGGSWLVYDANYWVEDYGNVWLRGVTLSGDENTAFDTITKLALIALPFMVIFASIGGYIITAFAFRPVSRITQAAEKIGEGKDLTKRINLKGGKDEIYTLASTFDNMFDRLQASFEKEKQFTSDASHELRTPITVIMAQCEYSIENATTVEEAKKALNTVLDQTQKMSTLVSQLLTLARADRGQTKLMLETVNLSELTEMVAAEQQLRADKKEILIETNIEPDLVAVGDETMLMRMLINIIENGIKYGKEKGHLYVNLYRDGADIIGRIRDDGIGISKENIDRIWERFYQVDEARTFADEGTGLGLSMVKWIAEAHGGSITAQSTLGKGTTFIFKIPIK